MAARRLYREPIHPGDDASFYMKAHEGAQFAFQWHSHPEFELALVTRGYGRRYVGDSMEAFSEGDFSLIGSNLPHTWYTAKEHGRVASRVIQFPPDAIPRLFSSAPELRGIQRLLKRAERGLKVTGTTRSEVTQIMLGMFEHPRWSWRHVRDLLSILGILADSSECVPLSLTIPPQGIEGSGKAIDTVFSLLHRPPMEIPSQAVAARKVGMSPQSFSRFFGRTVGKTYVAYVNDIRVMAACRDLIETDLSITDIAHTSGFANLSNFHRHFRAHKRVSPREFRARYRQTAET